jgi:hypothetical protein
MDLKEFFHFRRDLFKRWRNRVRAGNLKSVPMRVREYVVR